MGDGVGGAGPWVMVQVTQVLYWNVLPLHIRQAATIPVFKFLLKTTSMLWPLKTDMKFVSGYIDGIGSLYDVLLFFVFCIV